VDQGEEEAAERVAWSMVRAALAIRRVTRAGGWALVEPLLPSERVGPKGGRWEKHPRRRIVDAISYVVRTGGAWQRPTAAPQPPLDKYRLSMH